MPLVSVVIVTYCRPALVKRAIASALAQTMGDLEVVVAVERDDVETITALDEIPNPRVRALVNPIRRGPAAARDFGIQASKGQLIALLDDDDEWFPEKLEKQLAAVPVWERTISTTLSEVVTPYGKVIRPSHPYSGLEPLDEWLFDRHSWFKAGQGYLQTSTLLIPRHLFEVVRFGEARHEEWGLIIRAVKQYGFDLVTVKESLVTYYTGNTIYPWKPSTIWVDSMRDVITPRAYSGFCLTVATQGISSPDRNQAFAKFLRLALRNGRPTIRQLFAFVLIWLIPDRVRHKVRAGLARPKDVSDPASLAQTGS